MNVETNDCLHSSAIFSHSATLASFPFNVASFAPNFNALYQRALNSTIYPVLGTTGFPFMVEFIHVTGLLRPSV